MRYTLHCRIFSIIILFSAVFPKCIFCNNSRLGTTTEHPTYNPPMFADDSDFNDDDTWLEIDDMLIMNRYMRSGLSDKSFRWELGIVPYEFKEGDFNFTCIKFVQNENRTYENYLYIRNGKGFQAAVGNTRSGGQWLLLETNDHTLGQTHSGFYYSGAVCHELLHALGFEHEHQRDDRDSYIHIHYENINNDKYTLRNFLKSSELGISQESFGVPYNYESIMQYPNVAFSNNRKPTMTPKTYLPEGVPYPMKGPVDSDGRPVLGQTSYLSLGDILKIQKMYEGICPDTVENAVGGPFTTNVTLNRLVHLPKSRQLKQNLEKMQQSTTMAPTTFSTSITTTQEQLKTSTETLLTSMQATTGVSSTTTASKNNVPYEPKNKTEIETTTENENVIGNLSNWKGL